MNSGKEVGITDLLAEAEYEVLEVTAGLVDVPGPKGDKGETGPTGEPGPAGRDGLPGRDGLDGAPGRDGLDGLDGARGPAGIDGLNGKDGKDGAAGPAGPKGDRGDNGFDGRDGVDGAQGATGAKGDTGLAGAKGDTGAAGAKGDKGDAGATGAAGAKGDTGPAGADGAKGADGDIKAAFQAAATKDIPANGDQLLLLDSEAGSAPKKLRWNDLRSEAAKPAEKPSLLVYYGYPIAFRGLWEVNAVIDAMSAYDIYVCGATYQNPSFEEYASTVAIIRGLRARGVKVFGYVTMGSSLTDAQRKTAIDQWTTIGVDGVFLDEYGFDYGVTRVQQRDIVGYIHGKGIPACANAWTFEDVVCANKSELTWPADDWRYINFVTKNPDNLASPMRAGDIYLIENFCYDHLGVTNKFNAQERFTLIGQRNRALPEPLDIWGLAVFPETTPGVLDTSKMGALTLSEAAHYIAANAWMYDIDVIGGGGYSFGSNSQPIEIRIPGLPASVRVSDIEDHQPVNNYVTETFSRRIDDTFKLTVKNSATEQSVVVSNALGELLLNTPGEDNAVVGPVGPQGPKGDKGDKGDTGAAGAAGTNGTDGAAGAKGDTGATGAQGIQGIQGVKGDTGTAGTNGTNGQGVPVGGTTGQVLSKSSATDYATAWITPAAGGGTTGGLPTGGTTNQFLVKTSATDYASSWQTKTLLATNGTGREVQFRNSAALAGASKVSINADGNLFLAGDAVVRQAALANRTFLSVSDQYSLSTEYPLGISSAFSTQREWQAHGDNLNITTKAWDATYAGTATAVQMASGNGLNEPQISYDTAAATNSVAGMICSNPVIKNTADNLSGFFVTLRVRIPAWAAGQRWFVGLTQDSSALTDVDPSTLTNFIGFGVNSADTGLQYMTRATGTVTKSALNMPANIDGNFYTFMFYMPSLNGNITASVRNGTFNMLNATTGLPAGRYFLKAYMGSGAVATKASISISRGYAEHIYSIY